MHHNTRYCGVSRDDKLPLNALRFASSRAISCADAGMADWRRTVSLSRATAATGGVLPLPPSPLLDGGGTPSSDDAPPLPAGDDDGSTIDTRLRALNAEPAPPAAIELRRSLLQDDVPEGEATTEARRAFCAATAASVAATACFTALSGGDGGDSCCPAPASSTPSAASPTGGAITLADTASSAAAA